jgi:PAS domain S-box-containing protein
MRVSGESIRVLHVDDDAGFAELTARFLEREDERLSVEVATRASEGLELLADDGFDCIVSDYDMPGRNGIEFLETVREERPDIPFILYTGKGSENVASEAISKGVTDYLQKGGGRSQYAVLGNRIRNSVERSYQKRRLETLIENLPGVVYQCRNERGWPMTHLSGEVEDLTGYPPSEIRSRTGFYGSEIIHPEDQEDVWHTVQEAIERREPFEFTYRIVAAAGSTKWVWERGQLVADADGNVEILEGFITDVTERESARRELKEEREFVEQALDALDELFYVVGPNGEIQRWNDRLNEVSGYSDEEMEALRATDLFPDEQESDVLEAIDETLRTGSTVVDLDLLTAGGDRVPCEFTGSRLVDSDGDPIGLVGIGRKVSDR